MEPSLSEILSVRPEATVNPGVAYTGAAEVVHNLNQSAQFNAEMKQRQYAQNLENLKGIYSDLGAVQGMAIMDSDRPEINKKLANILSEIGTDPRAALAGPKYAQIQKDLGEVRSLATQSKQDNIAYQNANSFLQQDADLQTPENYAIVSNFQQGKLEQRKFPLLQIPPSFDAEKAKTNIMKAIGKKYAESEFVTQNGQSFIQRTSGTKFNRDDYMKDWSAGFAASPKIQKWAEYTFNRAKNDPAELGAYVDPDTGQLPKNPQELYNNYGKTLWGSDKEIDQQDKPQPLVANPYDLATHKSKLALTMEGVREGNREKLAAVKKGLENQPVPQNAAFLVKTYATMIQPTAGNPEVLNLPEGQGKVTEQPINNLTNNILKQVVESQKTTIKSGSALGASEAITSGKDPDLTTRTANGGIRITFFKKYTEDDKFKPGFTKVGDPVVDPNTGLKVVESTQVLPPRVVMTTLAPSLISKPILGQTVETASSYLNGKSATDIDQTIAPEKVEQETLGDHGKEVSSGAKGGKTYTYKGKPYSQEQVETAAKNLGLSVDAYIKKYGLKN